MRIFVATLLASLILGNIVKGEVWYERKLSEAERSRWSIAYSEWGLGESEEKLRKEWQGIDWGTHRKRIKVELLYDKTTNPPRPYIRETVLSKDLVAAAEQKKWREETGPQLTNGIEIPDFKRVSKRTENFGTLYTIRYEGNESIGSVEEEFRGPKGEVVSVTVFECLGGSPKVSELLHEALRTTIRANHSAKQTDFGTVIPYETKWGKANNVSYVTWVASPNFIVNIAAQKVDPVEIARVYGKKFPSALPDKFNLEKTEWGREEFEKGLQRTKSVLNNPISAGGAFERATEYVYCPVPVEDRIVTREIFEKIERWWQQNKNQTYWDDKVNLLVAKGQSPQDVKREADHVAAEASKAAQLKLNALLATPMSAEETIKATDSIQQLYDTKAKENKWRTVKTGHWEYEFSGNMGSRATRSFTGPTISRFNDRLTPLRAIFIRRTVDPGWGELDAATDPRVKNGGIEDEVEYRYHRLDHEWRLYEGK